MARTIFRNRLVMFSYFKLSAFGWLLLVPLFILADSRALADTVQLKDNRHITGVIDQASSDETKITIRTNAGTLQIPRANIINIEQEKNVSFTESSGDLAVAEGKLERALDLYEKALETEPDNQRLKNKISQTKVQIEKRDQAFYGNAFDQIHKLINEGQFEQAIEQSEQLQRRVRVDSAREKSRQLTAEAYIGLARKFRDTVNYNQSEQNYDLASQTDPQNPIPRLEKAEMLENSPTRKTEAIPLYIKGLDLASQPEGKKRLEEIKLQHSRGHGSELLEARFQLGKLYRDEKLFDKAADTLLEVMRLDKNYQFPEAVELAVDSYISFSKTQANEMTGENIDRIIQNLNSIIALKPTEQRAYLLLGRIYFDRKDWIKARENLQAAVRTAAGNVSQPRQEALAYLGITNRRLGDLNEAAAALQTLLDTNAASYDSICELAEIRLEQKDFTRAQELFKRALDMDKEKYRAYMGMGEALQKLGQFKEARDNYVEVVKKDPANANAQLRIAEAFFEEEKWDNAVDESDKAIQILTGNDKTTATKAVNLGSSTSQLLAQAYSLMGNANVKLEKANLARENFQAALKEMKDYPPALDGIGRTYQSEGLHKDAESYFNKAIAADPKNPAFYLSMGINWHKYRKSPEKALPFYRKYIELGGKDPLVLTWIKECEGAPPA